MKAPSNLTPTRERGDSVGCERLGGSGEVGRRGNAHGIPSRLNPRSLPTRPRSFAASLLSLWGQAVGFKELLQEFLMFILPVNKSSFHSPSSRM